MQFEASKTVSVEKIKKQNLQQLAVLTAIEAGKELFVDYG